MSENIENFLHVSIIIIIVVNVLIGNFLLPVKSGIVLRQRAT